MFIVSLVINPQYLLNNFSSSLMLIGSFFIELDVHWFICNRALYWSVLSSQTLMLIGSFATELDIDRLCFHWAWSWLVHSSPSWKLIGLCIIDLYVDWLIFHQAWLLLDHLSLTVMFFCFFQTSMLIGSFVIEFDVD